MSPHISQSVGTSHTFAPHRGHKKPSLLSCEWHTHRPGGDVSGRRVGKPINIRSAGAVPAPRALPEESARCAGGGMRSNRRSLKWPSFSATPNWPVAVRQDG